MIGFLAASSVDWTDFGVEQNDLIFVESTGLLEELPRTTIFSSPAPLRLDHVFVGTAMPA